MEWKPWNRVTNISKSNPINSLGDLFLKPGEKEGNLLVLKIKNYNEKERKLKNIIDVFCFMKIRLV